MATGHSGLAPGLVQEVGPPASHPLGEESKEEVGTGQKELQSSPHVPTVNWAPASWGSHELSRAEPCILIRDGKAVHLGAQGAGLEHAMNPGQLTVQGPRGPT